MSTFTSAEIEYLRTQPLARLATLGTLGTGGRPQIAPVGVFYDPETETVVVGSAGEMTRSAKFRNATARPDVAIVVDDLASFDPWTPRGVEIRGHAETFTEGGEEVGRRLGAPFPFHRAWIRIRPRRVLSWGIDTDSYSLAARDVA